LSFQPILLFLLARLAQPTGEDDSRIRGQGAGLGESGELFRHPCYLVLTLLPKAQTVYQHRTNKTWAKREFDHRMTTLDLSHANAVRESMRDMLRHRSQMVDTIMILDTLILGFAFDFVYNGTLPPDGNNNPYMPVWSALMATAQTVTFWSIYFMCRIKTKLDNFMNIMRDEQVDLLWWCTQMLLDKILTLLRRDILFRTSVG
jgi:hypothetical protein